MHIPPKRKYGVVFEKKLKSHGLERAQCFCYLLSGSAFELYISNAKHDIPNTAGEEALFQATEVMRI